MLTEAVGKVLPHDQGAIRLLQLHHDLPSPVRIDRGVEQVRQSRRFVCGGQQPDVPAAAISLQPQAVAAGELLIAVDQQHGGGLKIGEAAEPAGQPPLAVVQFGKPRLSACPVDRRHQGMEQGRFSRAVTAEDLSPPAVFAQTPNERFNVLAGRRKEGHGPRADAAGGEGIVGLGRCVGHIHITGLERCVGRIHGDVAFGGGTLPSRKTFWPTTSLPRCKNARTLMHQRIFTIWPS